FLHVGKEVAHAEDGEENREARASHAETAKLGEQIQNEKKNCAHDEQDEAVLPERIAEGTGKTLVEALFWPCRHSHQRNCRARRLGRGWSRGCRCWWCDVDAKRSAGRIRQGLRRLHEEF